MHDGRPESDRGDAVKSLGQSTSNARMIDLAGGGVCVALTLGVYVLGIEPRLERTAQTLRDLSVVSSREREAQELDQGIAGARKRLVELTKQSEDSAVRLEPPENINRRLEAITRLAETHHVTIDQLGPGSASTDTRHIRIPIKVGGTCGYVSFGSLIADLRAEFPDTAVNEFSISAPHAGDTTHAGFTLDLMWFAAPPGGAVAKGSAEQAGRAGRAISEAPTDGAGR